MNEYNLLLEYSNGDQFLLNPDQLVSLYLQGIPMCPANGTRLSDQYLRQKILDAQQRIESYLNIKIFPQYIRETVDFKAEEWNNWGGTPVTYPVVEVRLLQGFLNQQLQISYPTSWLTIRRYDSSAELSDQSKYFRQFFIVPSTNTDTPEVQGVVFNGVYPYAAYLGHHFIPNYWNATYLTGFVDTVPDDIYDAVGKLAAIQVLALLGEISFNPGVGSTSLSLDGLSQSINYVRSKDGGVYSGLLNTYLNDLKDQLNLLKGKYKGVNFTVL